MSEYFGGVCCTLVGCLCDSSVTVTATGVDRVCFLSEPSSVGSVGRLPSPLSSSATGLIVGVARDGPTISSTCAGGALVDSVDILSSA